MQTNVITYVTLLVEAAVLTVLLELPVLWLFLHRQAADRKKLLINIILVNLITNLFLNNTRGLLPLIPGFSSSMRNEFTLIAELVIPLAEAGMYHFAMPELPARRLALSCILANLVSFGAGLLWAVIVRCYCSGIR